MSLRAFTSISLAVIVGCAPSRPAGQPAVNPLVPAAVVASRPAFPAGTRFLRIIATNDFHGALQPRPDANGATRGGAAHVAAAPDRARDEGTPRWETALVEA